jgi:hypothetical protein
MYTLECSTMYHTVRYTNLLLVLSILYFFQYAKKTMIEYILVLFLIAIIVSSQLFWNNPIKGSTVHYIDAIIAKIVIITLMLYTLVYKFRFSLLFLLFAIAASFYFSDYYSNEEWCSDDHLLWHGLGHICCFIGTLYTFSPI